MSLCSDKDSEITELKIRLKEYELRLNHAEDQLEKERQDNQNNALAFKRILSNITASNKENLSTNVQ